MMKKYLFEVFVVDNDLLTEKVIQNLKQLCSDSNIKEFDINVTSIMKNPELADKYRIVATPTVIKHAPDPVCIVCGDLSDKKRALFGLDLNS